MTEKLIIESSKVRLMTNEKNTVYQDMQQNWNEKLPFKVINYRFILIKKFKYLGVPMPR